MLLAVFSVDWWGRERDEGYASFVLPTPGKFRILKLIGVPMTDYMYVEWFWTGNACGLPVNPLLICH